MKYNIETQSVCSIYISMIISVLPEHDEVDFNSDVASFSH